MKREEKNALNEKLDDDFGDFGDFGESTESKFSTEKEALKNSTPTSIKLSPEDKRYIKDIQKHIFNTEDIFLNISDVIRYSLKTCVEKLIKNQ